jgi:poly-gamma-glutamate biosynthesis protein PgsC/CapC
LAAGIFEGGVSLNPNAFFSETQSLTVGLGVIAGLVWSRRTGWSCGGIVTPGLLALYASDPARAALALALGAILVIPLSFVTHKFCLYGRERLGAAMLLALGAKIGFAFGASFFVPGITETSLWIGWVVPGMIAADGERQGLCMTLCGAISCALTAAFATTLLRQAAGF